MIMINKVKFVLVFIIGLLFGLIIHGIVEIVAIWFLLSWLTEFFFKISWSAWYIVHIVSLILAEIIALILVIMLYRKYEK